MTEVLMSKVVVVSDLWQHVFSTVAMGHLDQLP